MGNKDSVAVDSPMPQLLEQARAGNQAALDELVTTLYAELRRIAARCLRNERANHTLQATALVHEAYLKLFAGADRQFADRVHFLAVAARVIRQVLVDHARARATKKRGGAHGSAQRIEWSTTFDVEGEAGVEHMELVELDRALQALAREDATLAQLVEMRYFGGMTAEETAEVVGRSVHIVRHDLRLAQAWLRRELNR